MALNIDNTVYGRAPSAWDVDHKVHYLYRQQVKMKRDTLGYILAVTKEEKNKLLEEVKTHKNINRKYNLINNSCSAALVNVFGVTDILIVDPRWSFGGTISPFDIMNGLNKSPRLIKKVLYPKKMKKYLYFLSTFLCAACHTQEIKATTARDVPAYKSVDAVYSQPDFVIPKNSVCFLGEEVFGKVDRFVAVRCENGLSGFVIEDEAFLK